MRIFLTSENIIQPYEFLYILANCQNREDYLKKVLHKERKPIKDSYHKMSGTYRLEEPNDFLAPDILIQRILKQECSDKISIEGELEQRANFERRYQRKQTMKKNDPSNTKLFKEQLRDPKLFAEVRQQVKSANSMLQSARLNGRIGLNQEQL